MTRALALALALAACAAPRTPSPAPMPPPSPAAPDDAGAVVESDVPAPQEDPIRVALRAAWRAQHPSDAAEPRVLVGPVDLTDPATPGPRAAALMASGDVVELVATAVPYAASGAATQPFSVSGAVAEHFGELVARDVNGDRHPDAVLFRREDVTEGYLPLGVRTAIFTLRSGEEAALGELVRASLELAGVDSPAALDAALPTLGRYEAPAAGMSPARFIARLRYATPAEFRAAVAPRGLRLCTDFPGRNEVRVKRCTLYPTARLTDALITGRVRRDLGSFAEVYTEPGGELQAPACERRGAETVCGANIGGPAGVNWTLVGEGATMRLAEVSPWHEAS